MNKPQKIYAPVTEFERQTSYCPLYLAWRILDEAREHNDPKYILDLLKSFITMSMETMKIVNGLPALKERMAEEK